MMYHPLIERPVQSIAGLATTKQLNPMTRALKRVRRERAQRLTSEADAHPLLRAAKPGRDRLLLEVAYYGALRVSELASLTWGQVLPRETGEAQLAIVGKGDKPRNVLLPAELATALTQ